MRIEGGPLNGRQYQDFGERPREGAVFTVTTETGRHRYVMRGGQWVYDTVRPRPSFRDSIVRKGA